jgi:hypothetical protein
MQRCLSVPGLFTLGCVARISTDFATQGISFTKVTIHDLLKYSAFYHLKPVAVEGRYTRGFERRDIKPLVKHPFDSTIQYHDWVQAIWIDVRYSKNTFSCDSLNGPQVLIKGIFDTAKHGHMEGYMAEITDAVVSVKTGG